MKNSGHKNYPKHENLNEANLDDNSSLKKMLLLIGENKRIIDFGCATGYFSQLLTTKGCQVTGVEVNHEAAKVAEQYCEQVIVADLDIVHLGEILPNGKFDVAVFGDVLEHLRDPWRVLEETRQLLKPEGYVVASIPNIAHGAIRLALLQGKFDYTELGILDNTHLRFFTRETVEKLFESSGYYIDVLERTKLPIFYESNLIPSIDKNSFPIQIIKKIEQEEDADTLQFVVKAIISVESQYSVLSGQYLQMVEEVENLRSQLNLSQEQLQKTEELLQETRNELETSNLEANRLEIDLDIVNLKLQKILPELETVNIQLRAKETALEQNISALEQIQTELHDTRIQLQQAEKNSEYYHNVIEAMESSKFWKLRNAWFKLKSVKSNKVTIIVPIFNAYEDTKKCLDSLLLYTDYRHKVLLIDDASTDERIVELTKKLSSQYFHINCIRNSENFGFVRNCNIAFSKSEQTEDVILLNSDTIVTPHWLEKLILAAYSSSDIGTVTPLTNNGTICSVPNWLEENEIPEGYDVLSFSSLIESISLKKYPRIPTAVGFCMYIKRETLNKVGYFDEINFGKGYGEENDFCCRASNAGYYHIIDDSTFVYHAGTKSFGEEKQKLIQKNLAILSKLHPNYLPEVHKFIADKPIQNIINNIRLHLYLDKIRKLSPICFVLHNSTEYPVNSHLGGTEYHCAALITELRKIHPIYTLYFNKYKLSISLHIFFEEESISFDFPCQLTSSDSYLNQNTSFLNLFTDIVRYFQPAIIHIHHLINLPILDISSVLKQEKIPYLVSIHDYYFICPSYNLIDYQQQFCFEHKNEVYCQKCIQTLFSQGQDLKKKWSNICEQLLQNSELIIAPSVSAASYITREYPTISEKFRVMRHGVFTQHLIEEISINKLNSYKNKFNFLKISHLKVAFVGAININKGAKQIIEIIEIASIQNNLKQNLEFYFFGNCSEELPAKLTNLKLNLPYERQDLHNLLKDIDVVVFPTIWPETYCLTADEVLFCGVPIISSPIGAIAERIKEFGVGWVSQSSSSEDIINTLLFVKNHPEEYEKIKVNVNKYTVVSYQEMSYNYLQEYKKIIDNHVSVNQNISPKSTLILTPQDIFAAFNQDMNINTSSWRVPLSKKSRLFSFLKKNFFGIWEFLRMLAIKYRLIK